MLDVIPDGGNNGVQTNSTILITGESGTGKTWSRARFTTYCCAANIRSCALNCRRVPERSLESELFGQHARALHGRRHE